MMMSFVQARHFQSRLHQRHIVGVNGCAYWDFRLARNCCDFLKSKSDDDQCEYRQQNLE